MQRTQEVFDLPSFGVLPGFERPTQQIGTTVPSGVQMTDDRRSGVPASCRNSFQRFDRTDLVYRRIGVHRRIDYHKSAYQIPTFNTTDWHIGESAYTGESITIIRRIRFQRPTQQIGTPANRRTQANRLPSFGVSDSNVQHNRLVYRQIGVHRRIDYHHSAYQIPTSNTTDWHTGEAAYTATGDRRPASRRIRFQRPTQQIGTPANRRTRANRLPSFGVSDSNVQHNRLVHRRIGVHRRIDYHRFGVSDSNV